ncbi:hypothetical protein MMRN_40200 [Mycobacterium marinum]|nr:hypothetical protein MMRN_40200 [Mycobacterium marinum]
MLPGADAMGGSVAEFGEQTEAVQAQGGWGMGAATTHRAGHLACDLGAHPDP